MSQDDPFADLDDDQTRIKPRPGGRRPPVSPVSPGSSSPQNGGRGVGAVPLPPHATGLNPLENAALTLLALLIRLKNTAFQPDPKALHNQMITEVKAFEARARALGVSEKTVLAARYVLCTALDEAVLNTPWGNASIWSKQSLLITFHQEAWGGERFFVLLEKLKQDPAHNLHLLELMYICLALGFEGRYHVIEGGHSQLEEVRERLFRTIRNQRGGFERDLSPHWQGVVDRRNPLIRIIPLWVVSALACVLLLVVFVGFSFFLNRASDPVFAALHSLGREAPLVRPPPIPMPQPDPGRVGREPQPPVTMPQPPPETVSKPEAPPPPCLGELLAEEVRRDLVEVQVQEDQTTIRIRGDGLFGSGSAVVKDSYHPVLRRIAEALQKVPGQVLITGHSDNVPIFTPRFPSNWHLSEERANAVVALLAEHTGMPTRFKGEGRSDAEPLFPNDSAVNRARNRRVEITLFTPGCA